MTSFVLAAFVLSVLCLRTALASGLREGAVCANAPGACNPPLSCLGTGKHKKCFMRKGLGMVCGRDPYWVCEKGLICQGTCKNPVGQGGACNSRSDGCRPPLSCLGLPGNKKCLMKKSLGDVCGVDPFWVCQEGLTCEFNKCRTTSVEEAGSCNFPGEICVAPFSCIGNDGNKKCFKRRQVGMGCGIGPFSVCEKHLFCDGICKDTIGKGGDCTGRFRICHPSLKCEGSAGKKMCVIRRKGLGMMCDDNPLDPYWWCEKDLVCDDGVCKRPAGVDEECNNPNTACEAPLSCVGRPGEKKCSGGRGLGQRCGIDPLWLCAAGLSCVKSVCVAH